jgi:ParB-like chromosome segregation protein Spo0J
MSKKELFKTLNIGAIKADKGIIKTEDIKQRITILPELRDLIPPLKDEELKALEENILKNGCRDSLLVWEREGGEYILIDGHNRFAICQKHHLDFPIKLVSFNTMEEAKHYMIDNQLSRRNLSPEQASYLRGMRYQVEKLDKGKYERQEHKGQNVPYDVVDENLNPQSVADKETTAERLAKEYNVSEKTIKRDAQFAEGLEKIGKVNQGLKKDILSGKVKVNKSDIQQLAKVEEIEKPISSASDIPAIVETLTTKKNDTFREENEEQITQKKEKMLLVKTQIFTLLQKLDTQEADIPTLCDQIIEQTKTLKKLSVKE